MPTYEEFYKQYARRIRDAILRDGFNIYSITALQLRGSFTLSELKAIQREIDGLVYEGSDRHLSYEDRDRIYHGLSQELGFANLQYSKVLCKSASNDELTELVKIVEIVLKGGK